MIDRQRIATWGIATTAAATLALAAWLRPWHQAPRAASPPPPAPATASGHAIDVVFAVDTTGSMGGLLDGAKRTVWSIATHIHQLDPQADLHVGLVAYRDLGDDYVTKDFALTGDLDAMFAELSTYQAAGGGDVPEDVDAALYDAVHKMRWRGGATKLIFLVGDAPPATRGDVPAFDATAREAAAMQIKINAIRCGWDRDTEQAWREVAELGHGEFSTIQEDGGVQQIATPYDEKLAALSARVDATSAIYGGAGVHAEYRRKMAAAAAAPAAAAADRAAYYATGDDFTRDPHDLTARAAAGKLDVERLAETDLPADLRGLPKDAIAAELGKRAAQRAEAQKQIEELSRQRAAYLRAHAKGGAGFDGAVNKTLEHELRR